MPILFMVFKIKTYGCLKESFLLEVSHGVAGKQWHFVTEAGYAEGVPVLWCTDGLSMYLMLLLGRELSQVWMSAKNIQQPLGEPQVIMGAT